jgi:hypothetical protein
MEIADLMSAPGIRWIFRSYAIAAARDLHDSVKQQVFAIQTAADAD